MARATLQAFRDQFPEFEDTENEAVDKVLVEALLIHDIRLLATLYCAAHLLAQDQAIAAGKTTSPEVKSRKADTLSASYVVQAETGAEAFFTSTSYGKRFLTLEKRSPRKIIGAFVAG